jgi:predicted MFS family arabinose efflux permease
MLAAFGAGALIGAIAAGAVGRVRELGWVTLIASLLTAVGMALIGLAGSPLAVMAFIFVIGLAIGFINVRIVAWLQIRTPETMIGRMMSLVMMGGVIMSPISLAVAGVLVDLGAATAMYLAAGALILLATLAAMAWGVPAQMREE